MGHPAVFNHTPFVFEPLCLLDEDARPVLIGMLKASFRIRDRADGPLIPLGEQLPFTPAGELQQGDGEELCYRHEPDASLPKPGTDVVLVATARAPRAGLGHFDVGFAFGDTVRRARVFGDRVWEPDAAGLRVSEPRTVDTVPLSYCHAFGGRDQSAQLKGLVPFERRNPVGLGYHHPSGTQRVGAPLPNIELPDQLIRGYYDTPEPAGFGFVSPHWEPRLRHAGTYDENWEAERKPWLPHDFDRRHHNAAAPALTLDARPRGNERVRVQHASSRERLDFELPGLAAPRVYLELRGGRRAEADGALDTVVVDTDAMVLTLTFRSRLPLPTGLHDVARVAVKIAGIDRAARLHGVA